MRLLAGLMLLALACSASRGDDAATERQRRVKVALALSCPDGRCETKEPTRPVATLDWFVAADAKVEVAPPPRPAVAADKAKPAAPAAPKKKGCACGPDCPKGGCDVCDCATPATAPARQLWQMWDAQGRTWYEWRDPAPTPMPAAGPRPLDWQVMRPPYQTLTPGVVSPFPVCTGTA